MSWDILFQQQPHPECKQVSSLIFSVKGSLLYCRQIWIYPRGSFLYGVLRMQGSFLHGCDIPSAYTLCAMKAAFRLEKPYPVFSTESFPEVLAYSLLLVSWLCKELSVLTGGLIERAICKLKQIISISFLGLWFFHHLRRVLLEDSICNQISSLDFCLRHYLKTLVRIILGAPGIIHLYHASCFRLFVPYLLPLVPQSQGIRTLTSVGENRKGCHFLTQKDKASTKARHLYLSRQYFNVKEDRKDGILS